MKIIKYTVWVAEENYDLPEDEERAYRYFTSEAEAEKYCAHMNVLLHDTEFEATPPLIWEVEKRDISEWVFDTSVEAVAVDDDATTPPPFEEVNVSL